MVNESKKEKLIKPFTFEENVADWGKKRAKELEMTEQEFWESTMGESDFALVEFDEATGKASLKLFSEQLVTKDEDEKPEKILQEYQELRENFAPVSAGVEYHKNFMVGSGFDIMIDEPKDKHQQQMKEEIIKLTGDIYQDYYNRGLDKILFVMIDTALTTGAAAAEVVYAKEGEPNFSDYITKEDDEVKLQMPTIAQWKSFGGIKRLKIIKDAITRLKPIFDNKSYEILYWTLDEVKGTTITPDKEKKEPQKFLPWQIFWLSWNTRETELVGESIIRPVRTIAKIVKSINESVGEGFHRWANRKYFFVLGTEKRPWSNISKANFLKLLEQMARKNWTGIPVPQGFDVKEIGGQIFQGRDVLDHFISMIAAGMTYPRDFLEFGRTRAGDKAWLAWQVKYGSAQRQIRRAIEQQLFEKHLWCLVGQTYDVPKQGVPEKERETHPIFIPKMRWRAEGRWQQAEELKSLQGWLNVANPVGPEFKLAIEKRAAELLGLGEIEFPCYDRETEILTKVGWKFFESLTFDDEVATLNKNGYLEYQRPIEIMKYPYDGQMIYIDNEQVDLMVTPNHKLYVKTRDNSNKFRLIRADKVCNFAQLEFKKDAKWACEDKSIFSLPIPKEINTSVKLMGPFDMNDWLEFFGYYLTEGSASKVGDNYTISIGQSRERNLETYEKICDVLDRLGYKYDGGETMIRIESNRQLYEYLKQFGKSFEKYIPRDILMLPPSRLEILYDAMMAGDGCRCLTKTSNYRKFTSTSKRLMDDIQEILLKRGSGGNIHLHTSIGTKSIIRGRIITAKHNCYRIFELNEKLTPIVRGCQMNPVPYKGFIYSCMVPNKVIYVRRNGKSCWSGNSYAELRRALKAMAKEAEEKAAKKEERAEKRQEGGVSKQIKPTEIPSKKGVAKPLGGTRQPKLTKIKETSQEEILPEVAEEKAEDLLRDTKFSEAGETTAKEVRKAVSEAFSGAKLPTIPLEIKIKSEPSKEVIEEKKEAIKKAVKAIEDIEEEKEGESKIQEEKIKTLKKIQESDEDNEKI